jgi:hypothetical protein
VDNELIDNLTELLKITQLWQIDSALAKHSGDLEWLTKLNPRELSKLFEDINSGKKMKLLARYPIDDFNKNLSEALRGNDDTFDSWLAIIVDIMRSYPRDRFGENTEFEPARMLCHFHRDHSGGGLTPFREWPSELYKAWEELAKEWNIKLECRGASGLMWKDVRNRVGQILHQFHTYVVAVKYPVNISFPVLGRGDEFKPEDLERFDGQYARWLSRHRAAARLFDIDIPQKELIYDAHDFDSVKERGRRRRQKGGSLAWACDFVLRASPRKWAWRSLLLFPPILLWFRYGVVGLSIILLAISIVAFLIYRIWTERERLGPSTDK